MCRNPYYNKKYGIYCPCRQCEYCHKKRISHWTIRLSDEIESCKKKAFFITLTYANQHLPENFSLDKKHVQDWIKRIRKRIWLKLDKKRKIKYFIAGEYGSQTHRPHYHAVVFGLGAEEYERFIDKLVKLGNCNNAIHYQSRIWTHGHITIGYNCSSEVLRYVAKYINKKTYGKIKNKQYKDRVPPFHLSSQALGLSEAYRKAEDLKKDLYIQKGSLKLSIPPYYRKKLGIDAVAYKTIISEQNKKMVDILSERVKDVFIKKKIPDDLKDKFIDLGVHIDNKVLTYEAYTDLQLLRRQFNDNLRAKRKLSEDKYPDKI